MGKRWAAMALAVLLWTGMGLSGRVTLRQRSLAGRLIRLHVVGASDSRTDQWRKLRVRDALLPRIQALTGDCADAREAALALEAALPELQRIAARALATGEPVRVGLDRERFPRRDYPTFSLPAGSYRALRITLGEGAGHNWWCVAFPALCLPASVEEETWFQQAVQAGGFSPEEVELMTSQADHIQFRFRLLDWLFGEW